MGRTTTTQKGVIERGVALRYKKENGRPCFLIIKSGISPEGCPPKMSERE